MIGLQFQRLEDDGRCNVCRLLNDRPDLFFNRTNQRPNNLGYWLNQRSDNLRSRQEDRCCYVGRLLNDRRDGLSHRLNTGVATSVTC